MPTWGNGARTMLHSQSKLPKRRTQRVRCCVFLIQWTAWKNTHLWIYTRLTKNMRMAAAQFLNWLEKVQHLICQIGFEIIETLTTSRTISKYWQPLSGSKTAIFGNLASPARLDMHIQWQHIQQPRNVDIHRQLTWNKNANPKKTEKL